MMPININVCVMTSGNERVPVLTEWHRYWNGAARWEPAVSLHRWSVGQTQSWRRSGIVSLFTTCSAHAQLKGRAHVAFQSRGKIQHWTTRRWQARGIVTTVVLSLKTQNNDRTTWFWNIVYAWMWSCTEKVTATLHNFCVMAIYCRDLTFL